MYQTKSVLLIQYRTVSAHKYTLTLLHYSILYLFFKDPNQKKVILLIFL